jgi:hypothetical protein
MRPLFKTQFTILPSDGRTVTDAADEVMTTATAWITEHYAKRDEPAPLPDEVGEITRHPDQPYQSKNVRLDSGEFHRALYWSHPSSDGLGYNWSSLIDLAHAEGRLDFQFVLGVESADYSRLPGSLRPARPRLIPNLIANPHWLCLSGHTELPLFDKSLTIHHVDEFCEQNLFADDRRLPIVVMTRTPGSRSYFPVKPRLIADRLCGVAKVVAVRDDVALRALNKRLGSNLQIDDDTIRVFHPGCQKDDDPLFHWTFLGGTIRSKRLGQNGFADFLFARLADEGVIAVSDSPALLAFRRIAREQYDRRVEENRKQGSRATEAEELYFETEQRAAALENRVAALEEELRERDDRIRALERRYDEAQRNIADLSRALGSGVVDHAESAPHVQGETVAEIVRSACSVCPYLEMLSTAIDSAEQVPVTFKNPDLVREHLTALNQLGAERCGSESLGMSLKAWFVRHGLDYRGHISQTTENQWGDEYKFPYDGKKVLFDEHFTIGAKSANTCLSIHFSTRLRDDKVVVAYVGRHLTNTQT